MGCGLPQLSQEWHLDRDLGLTWVLKLFLVFAELIHLNHEHSARGQTRHGCEAEVQMGTKGLWERGGVSNLG